MRYKVGDKVRVREDLQVKESYGCESITLCMQGYLGQEAQIVSISKHNEKFHIDIDCGRRWWTAEMMEPVKEEKTLDVGDIVKYKDKGKDCVGYILECTIGHFMVIQVAGGIKGVGWYKLNDLTPVDMTGISIEVKDRVVTVKRGEEIGVARCAPEDLLYGIALAVSRLAKPWPSVGDKYFFITTYSEVLDSIWDDCYADKGRKKHNNFFRTEEEAEKAAKEIKAVFAKYREAGK